VEYQKHRKTVKVHAFWLNIVFISLRTTSVYQSLTKTSRHVGYRITRKSTTLIDLC